MLPRPGDLLGDYEIVAPLGRGAMGAVFRARHRTTGVEVALKLLSPDANEELLERFQREVEAMAKVDRHARIVRIRSTGTWSTLDAPFAVMDLIEGQDLGARLAHGPLPLGEALGLIETGERTAADFARLVRAVIPKIARASS